MGVVEKELGIFFHFLRKLLFFKVVHKKKKNWDLLSLTLSYRCLLDTRAETQKKASYKIIYSRSNFNAMCIIKKFKKLRNEERKEFCFEKFIFFNMCGYVNI